MASPSTSPPLPSGDTRRSHRSPQRQDSPPQYHQHEGDASPDPLLPRPETHPISPSITRRLFISHFLSTWNSRMFEFGAVLFLASIFPDTLLPMSVYALARGASAICFSPAVGRHIDTRDRLSVVRFSIVVQRIAAASSCVVFWALASRWSMARPVRVVSLVLLALLACVEKLCSIMNMISVERDWVVVIAGDNESGLRILNSQMRRIDLFCKLVGPLVIALIDGVSTEMAILVTLGLNVTSIRAEYYAIAKVFKIVPALQRYALATDQDPTDPESSPFMPSISMLSSTQSHSTDSELSSQPSRTCLRWIVSLFNSLRFYFSHPVFLPSISVSLLYLTVLSFSGQMVTYLLSLGYTSTHIGMVRTVSVMLEISATWIAPKVMSRIGPIRSGIWFLSWQMLCLGIAVTLFWSGEKSLISASALVAGVILSRVGLWGFDLSAQVVIQEEVDQAHRGAFSSLEASFQNAFELCSYVSTIAFSRPEQFQWPVLMSSLAVFGAGGLYTAFVRKRRGHLIHLSKCIDPKERRRVTPELGYERLSRSRDV